MKTKKKFISAILTLALIISLMPGMTLTASAAPNIPLYSFSYRVGENGNWQDTIEWTELEAGTKYYAVLPIPDNATFPINVYISYGTGNVILYPKESPFTQRFTNSGSSNSFTLRLSSGSTQYVLYASDPFMAWDGIISGKCGVNLTWTLDTNTGLLEINGTGPMDDWTVHGSFDSRPWSAHKESIRNVRISEGVTTIGDNAFTNFANITTVHIPASVTHIGSHAFYRAGITSITIPSTVKRIAADAFNRCSQLESVTIGAENMGADTESAEWQTWQGHHLFYNRYEGISQLDSLKHITIQGSVKYIPHGTFVLLRNLESVRIEEGVTRIGAAFGDCYNLTSVTLPNSLTYINDQAFIGTDSLKSITIPKNVTHIGRTAFIADDNITLRGYVGSAAQNHANSQSRFIRFEAITGDLPDVLPQTPTPPPPAQDIKVLVNGSAVAFDQPPIIENGRTLVPLRAIFEALGATVEWEQSTQTVTAVKDDITIILKIGDSFLTKNGERIALDVPAKIVGGRTLVPARAVAESFGAEVGWDQAARTVTITD